MGTVKGIERVCLCKIGSAMKDEVVVSNLDDSVVSKIVEEVMVDEKLTESRSTDRDFDLKRCRARL